MGAIHGFFFFLAVFDSLNLPFSLSFSPNIIRHNGILTVALLCVRRPHTFTRQMNPFSTLKWDHGSTMWSKSARLRISISNLIIEWGVGLNVLWAKMYSLNAHLLCLSCSLLIHLCLSCLCYLSLLVCCCISTLFCCFYFHYLQVMRVQLVSWVENKYKVNWPFNHFYLMRPFQTFHVSSGFH